MMAKRRDINIFNIAFLDLISGALGAVIILYVAVPKNKPIELPPVEKIEALQMASVTEEVFNHLKEVHQKTEAEKEALAAEVKELNEELIALKKQEITEAEKTSDSKIDVGFSFKGKKIIFIIDVSGSMIHEDRMGQVKAGLKMFVTSLTPDYSIDIVFYPDGTRGLYRSLWGFTQEMSERNKKDVYQFLNALFPFGATPTRDVLKYTLSHYRQITDIVLLSDGAPTLKNSSQVDDVSTLLQEIQGMNQGRVQINAIGVGSDMAAGIKSLKYDFLQDLSTQNEGFFHPF